MEARSRFLTLGVVILLVAACGTPPASSAPLAASAPASPAAGASLSTPATLVPSPTVAATFPAGALATTVSDRLRVRSEPRVADDSAMYKPLLPLGTTLTIVGGPVGASGYTWIEVQVEVGTLQDGVTRGWVAIADHDGTPWIARASIAGLEVATSAVRRATADRKDAPGAAASVNAFAIDAYRQLLRDPVVRLADKNGVFSPTSIMLALGMVRAGARGDTAAQMDHVLHTNGWNTLGTGLNALDQVLASRNASWTDGEDAPRQVALRVANTTFAQRGWAIEPAFLDAVAAAFGAGVNLVDYQADPEAARKTINAWVDQRTGGRIPELLAPKNVTSLTRLYLVNAIYLKAEWDEWFSEGGTEPKTFTRLDGSTVKVPTMVAYRGALTPVTPYAKGNGWQAVELAYRSQSGRPELAMDLIIPTDLAAFEASLSTKQLDGIVGALADVRRGWSEVDCPPAYETGCYPYDLELHMPKFGIETRASLVDLLKALGMPVAFVQGQADFTGIHVPTDPMDHIYISDVVHQANIEVDEKGTEAAAATAVGMNTGGGPSALKQVTLRLDHPFLFLLRDLETGTILFMGRVVDPSIRP